MRKILQTAFMLMLITHWASAQDRTVTGTVKDKASGTAMPGVNVTILYTSVDCTPLNALARPCQA